MNGADVRSVVELSQDAAAGGRGVAENEKKTPVVGGGTVKGTTRGITEQSITGPITIGGITITGTKKDTKKK
ncbi:hypothetical protein ACWGOK_27815 [Streptomyces eurythermus]